MSHPLTSMEEREVHLSNMLDMLVHALVSHPLTSREEREEQYWNMHAHVVHALVSHPLTSMEEREEQSENMNIMFVHALVSHPLVSSEESEVQFINMRYAVKSLSPKGVLTSRSEEQLVKIVFPLNTVFGRVISRINEQEEKALLAIWFRFLKYTSSLNLTIDLLFVNRPPMLVTASTCS